MHDLLFSVSLMDPQIPLVFLSIYVNRHQDVGLMLAFR